MLTIKNTNTYINRNWSPMQENPNDPCPCCKEKINLFKKNFECYNYVFKIKTCILILNKYINKKK